MLQWCKLFSVGMHLHNSILSSFQSFNSHTYFVKEFWLRIRRFRRFWSRNLDKNALIITNLHSFMRMPLSLKNHSWRLLTKFFAAPFSIAILVGTPTLASSDDRREAEWTWGRQPQPSSWHSYFQRQLEQCSSTWQLQTQHGPQIFHENQTKLHQQ